MNKKEFCSRGKTLDEYFEKEAERALQGECMAQKRLSEAEVQMDRKSWEGEQLTLLQLKPINN